MSRLSKSIAKKGISPANDTPFTAGMHGRIERRAFEIYQLRGEIHGHDLEDWFEAERLVRYEVFDPPREVG